MGYLIEVYILTFEKVINGNVTERESQWLPVGSYRPTLDQAKAALQALRSHKLYSACPMRIVNVQDGLIVLEVAPGDPVVMELS